MEGIMTRRWLSSVSALEITDHKQQSKWTAGKTSADNLFRYYDSFVTLLVALSVAFITLASGPKKIPHVDQVHWDDGGSFMSILLLCSTHL